MGFVQGLSWVHTRVILGLYRNYMNVSIAGPSLVPKVVAYMIVRRTMITRIIILSTTTLARPLGNPHSIFHIPCFSPFDSPLFEVTSLYVIIYAFCVTYNLLSQMSVSKPSTSKPCALRLSFWVRV